MLGPKNPEFSYADFANAMAQLRSCDLAAYEAAIETLQGFIAQLKNRVRGAMETEGDTRVKAALSEILSCCGDPKFVWTIAKYLDSDSAEVQFWSHVALTQLGTPEALRLAHEKSVVELLNACVTETKSRAPRPVSTIDD